ncbi:MAG: hypothetical protein H7Z75_08340 [Ferruginibacter sp.]|nr:hypothetical protein [Cytophagales bacterium]
MLLLNATGALGQEKYKSYCNSRHDYCIVYPGSLVLQTNSGSGDGDSFVSKDGQATLTVWGASNAVRADLETNYASAMNGKRITYKVLRKNWYVISGYTKRNAIFYQKTVLSNGVFKTCFLEYPRTQREVYDKTCKVIGASLTP